ncbi:hypothetical protein KKD03_02040 [Patescibacteria group bacterium]|nr:hypothetical protein [Patescibacteria group bacterium]
MQNTEKWGNNEEAQKRAIAEDELAEKTIDETYINNGNYNRPVASEETLTYLKTRDEVNQEGLDDIAQTVPEVISGEKKPLSYVMEQISKEIDEIQKSDEVLYESFIDEMLASRELRNSLPKETDFAIIIEAFNSIFGFDKYNGRSDFAGDGFENYGVDFLFELSDKNDDTSKKSLDAIFSTGWKGVITAAYFGKSLTTEFSVEKEQHVAARKLFDAKIALYREQKRSESSMDSNDKE